MNSHEIAQAFRGNKSFLGVYAIDTIPKRIPFGKGLILNLDYSYEPGTHWVGLYKSVILEYFDSYGKAPPTNLNIREPILYNKKVIQDPVSISCGKFAVYFVRKRIEGESFYNIQNSWSNNLIFNDLM